jgi:phosphatidylinositol alpha-1,6-mannosyltransferase
VFIEAGARGLPVVAGRGAGADDAVVDGQSGVLVDPEDATEVADAIVRLVRDPEIAARLGEGGRRLAETTFSSGRFRASVVDIVLGMHPPGLVAR